MLEIASWFVPLGELTKLRCLKTAAILFKAKRGIDIGIHGTAGVVDLTTQLIVNRGDIKKINLVGTLSSTLIGNPFLSAVTGAFINLSYDKVANHQIVSSALNINVYKSILVTTLGNIGGEKFCRCWC